MTPEERDLIDGLFDRLKKDAEAEQLIQAADPDNDPKLGVDWGSNIDPGPGPDPSVVDPGDKPKSGSRAV